MHWDKVEAKLASGFTAIYKFLRPCLVAITHALVVSSVFLSKKVLLPIGVLVVGLLKSTGSSAILKLHSVTKVQRVNYITMALATVVVSSSFLFGTGAQVNFIPVNTQIAQVAKSMKENPQYYIEVAKKESGSNIKATNPRSSSKGLYQFIDSTWEYVVDKYGDRYQITMNGRMDVRESTVGMILFTRENRDYLRDRLDHEPTNKELYIAHFAGNNMAVDILTANPREAIVNVVGRNVVRVNPQLRGKTVAQAIEILTQGITNE